VIFANLSIAPKNTMSSLISKSDSLTKATIKGINYCDKVIINRKDKAIAKVALLCGKIDTLGVDNHKLETKVKDLEVAFEQKPKVQIKYIDKVRIESISIKVDSVIIKKKPFFKRLFNENKFDTIK
jgi:hypothetical protein